jgi:hypothetical protein
MCMGARVCPRPPGQERPLAQEKAQTEGRGGLGRAPPGGRPVFLTGGILPTEAGHLARHGPLSKICNEAICFAKTTTRHDVVSGLVINCSACGLYI